MADNKTIDNGGLTDFTAATDEIAGVDYQYIKIVDGTPDSTAKIQGTEANGLEVDVTRIAAGTKIQLTDGTSDATVRNLAANDALNVAIVDGAGNHVTSFAGSGGSSATDGSVFTPDTTAATTMMGFYQTSPSALTSGDVGAIGVTQTREMKVSLTSSALDVAHDAADAGDPALIGMRAQSALPTRVANNDRARAISDLHGRQLVGHIDQAEQVWKNFNATTTQTGAIIWNPAAGKKIAITHFTIGTYGTTSARLIMYFGADADTTYDGGTDQLVFAASYAPSTTSKPGTVVCPPVPIFAATVDHSLHITTDAAMSVDVACYGYEFTP